MTPNNVKYFKYFNLLKQNNHFSNLKDNTVNEILHYFNEVTWRKNKVFSLGEKTQYKFYFVVSGRIKMYKLHPTTGNEFVLYINSDGDIFDVIPLLDGKKHQIEMETLDEVVLLEAPIIMVRKWIEMHPNFNKTLLPYIAKKLRLMEEKANDLALFDTWTRTLKLFAQYATNNLQQTELRLINNLSHTEIAKIIGTSKNVINRHIQRLKDNNIIHVNRKNIEIKNHKELLKLLK